MIRYLLKISSLFDQIFEYSSNYFIEYIIFLTEISIKTGKTEIEPKNVKYEFVER